MSLILQTFFSHATFCIRVPNGRSSNNGRFIFSSPSDEFVNNFMMFKMKMYYIIGRMGPLCLYIRQTGLSWQQRKCILLLFKPWSMFIPKQDPLLWIYLHPQVCGPPQKIHSRSLHQKLCLTIFHLISNTSKACQSLGCHILVLESSMEVFIELL